MENKRKGNRNRKINLLLGIENSKRWLATKIEKGGVSDEWLFGHLLDVHDKYCKNIPVVETTTKGQGGTTDLFQQVLKSKHGMLEYNRRQLCRSEDITKDKGNSSVIGSLLLNQTESAQRQVTAENTPKKLQTTENVVQPTVIRLNTLQSTSNTGHPVDPNKPKIIKVAIVPTNTAPAVDTHSQQTVPMVSLLNLNGSRKDTNIVKSGIAPVATSQATCIPQQQQIFPNLTLLRTADVTSVPVGTNRAEPNLVFQTSHGQQGKQTFPQLTMLRGVVVDPNNPSVRVSNAASVVSAQVSYVEQNHGLPHTITSSADPMPGAADISIGTSSGVQIPTQVNVVPQEMQMIPPNVTLLRQPVESHSYSISGVPIVTSSAAPVSTAQASLVQQGKQTVPHLTLAGAVPVPAEHWQQEKQTENKCRDIQENTPEVKPELSLHLGGGNDRYDGDPNLEPYSYSSSCGLIKKQLNPSLNTEPHNVKFLLFPKELNNGDKIGDKLRFSENPSVNLMVKGMTRSSALNPPDEGPGSERKLYILNFLEMYFTAKIMQQQGIPVKTFGKVYRNMYIILQAWLHAFYGIKVSSSAVKSKCDKVFKRFQMHDEHYNKNLSKESFSTLCMFLSKSLSSIWFSDSQITSEEHEEIDPSGSSPQQNDDEDEKDNYELDFKVYRVFHEDEDMKPDITDEVRPEPERESSLSPENTELVFPIKEETEELNFALSISEEQNQPTDANSVNLLPKEELDSDTQNHHSDSNSGNVLWSENEHLSDLSQINQPPGSSQMSRLDQDQPSVSEEKSEPDHGNSDLTQENNSDQNNLSQSEDQPPDSIEMAQPEQEQPSGSVQHKPGRRQLEPRGKRKKFTEDFTQLFRSDSDDEDSSSDTSQPEQDEQGQHKGKRKRISEDFDELFDSEDEYVPPKERKQGCDKRKRFAEDSDSASDSMLDSEDDDNDDDDDDDDDDEDDDGKDEDNSHALSASPPPKQSPHIGGKSFNKLGQVLRYDEEYKQQAVAYAMSTNISAAAKKFDIQRDRIRIWKKKMTPQQEEDVNKGDDLIADEWKDNPLMKSAPKRPVGRPKKMQNTDSESLSPQIELASEESSTSTCTKQISVRSTRGQYQRYTLKDKKEAVKLSYEHGLTTIERRYNLPHSTLMNWRKSFSETSPQVERDKKTGRKVGSGRNFFFGQDNEDRLVVWIKEQRDLQIPFSKERFMTYARELVNKRGFKASQTWLMDFLKRNTYSLRTRTPKGHHLPERLMQRSSEFTEHVQGLQLEHQFDSDCIINMDETVISHDDILSRTPHQSGKGTIGIRAEKTRATFVLAITASGQTLPPMVIFKGERQQQDDACMEGVLRRVQDHGQMVNSLMVNWLLHVVKPHTDQRPAMLVLDSYSEHMTEQVQAAMKQYMITPVYIPVGCTSKVQPLNVSISKSFKASMVKEWSLYMDKQVNQTQEHRTPSPTKSKVLEWARASWDAITDFPALIKHSFAATGIITASGSLELSDSSDWDSDESFDWFAPDDIPDSAS